MQNLFFFLPTTLLWRFTITAANQGSVVLPPKGVTLQDTGLFLAIYAYGMKSRSRRPFVPTLATLLPVGTIAVYGLCIGLMLVCWPQSTRLFNAGRGEY